MAFPALRHALVALLAAALTACSLPALAQAPDCTGISDVSDFDGATVSDMEGVLTTVRMASGLDRPVYVTSPPGDTQRLFIVEQPGVIKILRDGNLLPQPFLDISSIVRSPANGGGGEEGLLGLAFHPDFAANGRLFVYHTEITGEFNILARYEPDAGNPDLADLASRVEVLRLDHPTLINHNGGMIGFGPDDGYLYIATGDGGGFCDPFENAQNLGSLLGKILRIDVSTEPYGIPPDNPFVGGVAGEDEIWSYGLRHPWRWSFDRMTGAFYIADVGQDEYEEINCRPASGTGGNNYGWDHYEGSTCPNATCGDEGTCNLADYVPPVFEYTHLEGCSVIGGYVYRGCRMSDLHGHYFFADYCSDAIRSFRTDAQCAAPAPLDRTADVAPAGGLDIRRISSFGEDARGELYLFDRPGGEMFKLLPELSIMEVSGRNAAPLRFAGSGDWAWEDLPSTSSHPVASYRVYRSDADPSGPFVCVHQSAQSAWSGGDPAAPLSGEAFFYLVTARNAAGDETRPGNRSDLTPRSVDSASACPP